MSVNESFISKVTALPGFVLIQPLDETEAITGSVGTFQTADSVKDAESQRIGKVLSIGEQMTTIYGAVLSCPPQITIGSIVIHGQYSYDRFQYKGEAIKLVAFNELKGIVND